MMNKNSISVTEEDIDILEKRKVGIAHNVGARVLNLDHMIGSIEVGKRADLVLFETESIICNQFMITIRF